MERRAWSDERIDERMTAIDATFARMDKTQDALLAEMRGLRAEVREEIRGLRADVGEEFRAVRGDLSGLQRQLAQIGWAMVGTLTVALVALVVALI
jgi:hypothetical protein